MNLVVMKRPIFIAQAVIAALLCSAVFGCYADPETENQISLSSALDVGVSAVYAGGPVYIHRNYSINELKNSGFTNVIIWTIHIEKDGSMNFNAEFPVVDNGDYIGDKKYPYFRDDVKSLLTGATSITRVEFGLAAWGSGTYHNVRDLVSCNQSHCGTGQESILYRNFKVLREAFPDVVALNNDDESVYDLNTAVPFHIMLADIGFKTSIVPYTQRSFWQSFVNQVNQARPGFVDLNYLQVYAGGSGNNPCDWDLGIPLFPGLWSKYDSPSSVKGKMKNIKDSCGTSGGFMWLYDDFDDSPRVAQYADAINSVYNDPGPTPTPTPNPTPTPTPNPTSTPTPGESCANSSGGDYCGEKSADGCWCDSLCEQYNDCCPDKEELCDGSEPTPTPTPNPTPTPTPNPTPTPTPGESCADSSGGDYCGEKSADGCWCDSLCEQYNDCCPDKEELCD